MARLDTFIDSLTQEVYSNIEYRAELNQGPSEIAEALELDKRHFLNLWRNPESKLRMAYERGRADIERKKNQVLAYEAEKGNITAIQIHDKKARARKFEDIKKDIFGFE